MLTKILGLFAGYRTLFLVVVVLGAIGIGYITIQQIQNSGKQELQIEQLQEELETRERIDEAIRTSPRDVDGADRVLRDFINSNR